MRFFICWHEDCPLEARVVEVTREVPDPRAFAAEIFASHAANMRDYISNGQRIVVRDEDKDEEETYLVEVSVNAELVGGKILEFEQ